MSFFKRTAMILISVCLVCVFAGMVDMPAQKHAVGTNISAASCLAPLLGNKIQGALSRRAMQILSLPYNPYRIGKKIVGEKALQYHMDMIIQIAATPDVMHSVLEYKIAQVEKEIALGVPDAALSAELRELWATLAGRLGDSGLEDRFLELAFRIQDPARYKRLLIEFEAAWGFSYEEAKQLLSFISFNIEKQLQQDNIYATVSFRVKSINSMYEKIQAKKHYKSMDQLLDIFGIRILFSENFSNETKQVSELYRSVLKAVPATPIFKQTDRKKIQKEGYDAWHLGFNIDSSFIDGIERIPPVEIQVLSSPNLYVYRHGVPKKGPGSSAHWAYKIWRATQRSQTFDVYPDVKYSPDFDKNFTAIYNRVNSTGTYLFQVRSGGTLEAVKISPNATPVDCACELDMFTPKYGGMIIFDSPADYLAGHSRLVSERHMFKPGQVVFNTKIADEYLHERDIRLLYDIAKYPVSRLRIHEIAVVNQQSWQNRKDQLIAQGEEILEDYFNFDAVDVYDTLNSIARALDFENYQDLAAALGLERDRNSWTDESELIDSVLYQARIVGMELLTRNYSLNLYDQRIVQGLRRVLRKMPNMVSLDNLFMSIGLGSVNASDVISRLSVFVPSVKGVEDVEQTLLLNMAA